MRARGSEVLPAPEVSRWAAVLAATDARRADTSAIDEALRSSSSIVRAAAVRAIGQNRMRARAAVARALVADPDTVVAADAAFALGLLRDSASLGELAAALRRDAVSLRQAAAWSLGEIGAPGHAVLLAELRRPASEMPRVVPSIIALAKARPVPVAALVPLLEHEDAAVRRAAAYSLARTRNPGAVRALVRLGGRPATAQGDSLVRSYETETRAHVGRALASQNAGDSLRSDALAMLGTLASDPHPHVRINAARSLASYEAGARAPIERLLRDPDANVRLAAAQTATPIFGRDSTAWSRLFAAESEFTVRRYLLSSAARAGVALDALAGADTWFDSGDWREASAAAEALAALPLADRARIGAERLRTVSRLHANARAALWSAMLPIRDSAAGGWSGIPREELERALSDDDVQVRSSLLAALAARADVRGVPLAIAQISRTPADRDDDARNSAWRYVGAAWRRDSAAFTDSLRARLRSLPPAASAGVRTALRGIPLFPWAAEEAAGTRPPLQWYEARVRAAALPTLAGRPRRAEVRTARGTIEIELFGADAPLTVHNFDSLARAGFFRGSSFHRVVPNFVAQDGDPRGDGTGGPGYAIRDELNRRWYDRGALGMALSGPDTGGSQWFLTHAPQPHLDGGYTVFGRVVAGFDALDRIVQGDRILEIRIR